MRTSCGQTGASLFLALFDYLQMAGDMHLPSAICCTCYEHELLYTFCLQVVVVCLVVLDAIFVMGEVLIDLAIIKLKHDHILPEVRMPKRKCTVL